MLHNEDGEAKSFVELFVLKVHQRRWDHAEDHWERTVVEFLNRARELEKLSARNATRRAEDLAQSILWVTAKRGRCPWCSPAHSPRPDGL
ncbi:DUF6313 family protein [Sphaerisporangium sp. NPDC004334]